MKTGLIKKQNVTTAYYNANDSTAEAYTHHRKVASELAKEKVFLTNKTNSCMLMTSLHTFLYDIGD